MMTSAAAAVTTTSITHHHADEVFSSWGLETIDAVNKEQLTAILEELAYGNEYGDVLRAKGMLPSEKEGEWYYFDMVPEQYEIRTGAPDYTGKVCVIGANLKEVELKRRRSAETNCPDRMGKALIRSALSEKEKDRYKIWDQ